MRLRCSMGVSFAMPLWGVEVWGKGEAPPDSITPILTVLFGKINGICCDFLYLFRKCWTNLDKNKGRKEYERPLGATGVIYLVYGTRSLGQQEAEGGASSLEGHGGGPHDVKPDPAGTPCRTDRAA